MKPDYTHSRSDEEDKYITWYTARNDIDKQKNKGVVGIRYCIEPILYDKNKGKTRKKTVFWNMSGDMTTRVVTRQYLYISTDSGRNLAREVTGNITSRQSRERDTF